MAQQISNLNVGDKVLFGKYQVNNETPESIAWTIVDKNHVNHPENSVTLLTSKMLDVRPANSVFQEIIASRTLVYKYSALRKWLNTNKSGGVWWENTLPDGLVDYPPSNANTSYNVGYDNKNGFLTNFTDEELSLMLVTDIPMHSGLGSTTTEMIQDRVFLLDDIEYGMYQQVNSNPSDPSFKQSRPMKLFPYDFDLDRPVDPNILPGVSQQVIDNSTYSGAFTPVSEVTANLLRSTYIPSSGTETQPYAITVWEFIVTSMQVSGVSWSTPTYGFRPAVCLTEETEVSDTPNADGYYEVIPPEPEPPEPPTTALRPREIEDRVATGDNKFTLTNLGDGRTEFTPNPDSVEAVGTDINKAFLQPLENRVAWLVNIVYDNTIENSHVYDLSQATDLKINGVWTEGQFPTL